jgi:hypothetical protein
MEELFIEEDGKKDILSVDDIILSDDKEINYEDMIINSFENLNLEDFKNHSYKVKMPGDMEHFNEYMVNEYPIDGRGDRYNDYGQEYPYEEEKVYSYHDDMNLFNEDIESFSDSLPVNNFLI